METIQEICSQLRFHTTRRSHALREALRASNHLSAIGRVAVGKVPGGAVPERTMADFTALGALFNPVFAAAIEAWEHEQKAAEKDIRRLAESLPAWSWVESDVRGVGALGFGLIVGAATHHSGASIERFPNPSAFWKRMGLAVIDGERQRRVAGTSPAQTELAIKHGYSPSRRSLMFVISEAMLKQNKGQYRALYDARKALEVVKLGDGHAMHAHKRALRFMAKRLLLHLWCVWTGVPINDDRHREADETKETDSAPAQLAAV